MPTPLGHAMAGVAIAWSAQALRPQGLSAVSPRHLTIACAALAIAPDFDLVYPPIHRMVSHSLTAIVLVSAIAGILMLRTKPQAALTVGVISGLAYASHMVLDWLGGDTKLPAGIQLLWPFSPAWFISPVRLFRATDVHEFFRPATLLFNALAIVQELLILGPLLVVSYRLAASPRRNYSRDYRPAD